MLKVCFAVIFSLSFSLVSCKASTAPSLKESANSQTEQDEQSQDEALTQPTNVASFTPLRLGKKITQINPYIMANYGFQKLYGAEHFQISLFSTAYESMSYHNDQPVLAILFIQRGDLQEIPLAFYLNGDLDPEFSATLTFCVFDADAENMLIVYAGFTCDSGNLPGSGSITIEFDLRDNIVTIDGEKDFQLN